jgi:hypothetical protein
MQKIPAPASERSPPRQATRATPAAPFRIIPGSAYCALWRILHKAHLLRDLKDLYDFEEGTQDWAGDMATLLVEARDAARDARRAGETALDPQVLADLTGRYRELAAAGLAANLYRRTATAGDARRIARRFLSFEDMILRFATRPDLDIFTNDLASHCTSWGCCAVSGWGGRLGWLADVILAWGGDIFGGSRAAGDAVGVAAA